VIHSERAGVPFDVVPTFLRIAEDEPVECEILERHGETLSFGIGLSRPQSAYARYFGTRYGFDSSRAARRVPAMRNSLRIGARRVGNPREE